MTMSRGELMVTHPPHNPPIIGIEAAGRAAGRGEEDTGGDMETGRLGVGGEGDQAGGTACVGAEAG